MQIMHLLTNVYNTPTELRGNSKLFQTIIILHPFTMLNISGLDIWTGKVITYAPETCQIAWVSPILLTFTFNRSVEFWEGVMS